MKAIEMLDIILHCVPCENGFVNEDTGEIFTDEALLKIEDDLNKAIDFLGMKTIELDMRAKSRKELAKHYEDEAKLDEKRAERLKFFLGYLTQGKKTACEHVNISFLGKQERLVLRCKSSDVPNEFKRTQTTRVPDTTLIRAELEKGNAKVAEFAYIDLRKKATVK